VKERLTQLKELAKKVAPKVGFPIFYLFVFILFLSWCFPYDRLKERIMLGYNAAQHAAGSNQELQIEDMTSSWITGVAMHNVKLTAPAPPGDATKGPSELKIDEATLRVSLLGLLVGNKDLTFHVHAFGGTVDGKYDDYGKSHSVGVEINDVDIGKIPQVVDTFLGLPVQGTLVGSIQLDMPPEDKIGGTPKTNGSVQLAIADMSIGDGKSKIKIPMFGELAVPRLNVGAFAFVGEAKDGVLTVKKFGAGGKDLELQGDGRMQLREPFGETGLDLNVRIKVNDAFRGKTDMTKLVFGAPGTDSAIFDTFEIRKGVPISKAKRSDGFYAWHFRGQVAHPDYAPAGGGSLPASPGVGAKLRP
jgi:type II secretion system protein N